MADPTMIYGGKGGQMGGIEGMPPQAPANVPSPADLPQAGQMGALEQMVMQLYGVNPNTMMQKNPLYGMPSQFAPQQVLGENVLLRESDYDPATNQWMKAQPGSVPVGMGEQYNLEQSIKKRK